MLMVSSHKCHFRRNAVCSVVAALAAVVVSGCSEMPDLEVSRKFQEAEDLFVKAESPKELQRVASLHQEILDGGFESGVVFYNQGNAWMQAARTGRAIASYRQAQRHLPRDPYLKANLEKALQASGQSEISAIPVLDHIFFWQNRLSCQEKILLATLLLGIVLLLALVVRQVNGHQLIKRINAVICLCLVLLAVSIVRDWRNQRQIIHGVVVQEIVARKGGSTTYEPAFRQPLLDGTEFVVLDTQNDWHQIEIYDTATGWIPTRSATTY